MAETKKRRVLITGAAGLVGQNLIPALKASGEFELFAADKHPSNTQTLRDLHPDIEVLQADLAEPGAWQAVAASCESLILLHAQIGGLQEGQFERNNIDATRNVLAAAAGGACEHVVHVSSSVVNSRAVDLYTESKKAQERLVVESGLAHVVLRPTLMFGWFDRKHLGWLRRFMASTPVFPVPGQGRYLRQPLYAGDFSSIIAACVRNRTVGVYDISGLEKLDYIDLIRMIREVTHSRTAIVRIPYALFWWLLRIYALFDRDPPFTTAQLEALATPELFPVIDWPGIFGVTPTPLRDALSLTFEHPQYSQVALDF